MILFLLILFAYPMLRVFLLSLGTPPQVWAEYRHIFREPVYLNTVIRTIRVAAAVTVLSALLGYPVAYLVSEVRHRVGSVVLLCVLLPFWTSILVRTFAWMILLQYNGLLNRFLLSTGLLGRPLNLMYNEAGVIIGMTHALLPFMVFPVTSAVRAIPPNLKEAAQNLGASSFRVFTRVILPLSASGLVAGSLLVFLTAIGFFITPALLGGRRVMMIAMLIEQQVVEFLNWPFASAIAMVLFLVAAAVTAVYLKLAGVNRLWGGN